MRKYREPTWLEWLCIPLLWLVGAVTEAWRAFQSWGPFAKGFYLGVLSTLAVIVYVVGWLLVAPGE